MILHQSPDSLLFIDKQFEANWHKHQFLQLGFGLFNVSFRDNDINHCDAFLINSQVEHRVKALQCTEKQHDHITLLVDRTSLFGRFLIAYLNARTYLLLPKLTIDFPNFTYIEMIETIYAHLGFEGLAYDLSNQKLLQVLTYLDCQPNSSLSELAKLVNLSPSRLSHLFSDELGLPLSSYQRQLKIRNVFLLLGKDKHRSLTDIALEAGFNDSAHFSNTFKSHFGLTAKSQLNRFEYHYHSKISE